MDIEVDGEGIFVTGDQPPPGRRRRGRGQSAQVVSEETRRELYNSRQTTFWILAMTLLHQKLVADGKGVEQMTPEEKKELELDELLQKLAKEEAGPTGGGQDGHRC